MIFGHNLKEDNEGKIYTVKNLFVVLDIEILWTFIKGAEISQRSSKWKKQAPNCRTADREYSVGTVHKFFIDGAKRKQWKT